MLRRAPGHKPWVLPKRLVNDLSGETSLHHRISLFDARLLHRLDISASNFRAEEDYYLDAFLKHRLYSGTTKRGKSSLLQARNAFILNVQHIGREAWLRKLDTARVRFGKQTLAGAKVRLHKLSREAGIPCRTWGDPCPCCLTTINESTGICNPFLRPGVGRASQKRCAMRFLICNRPTSGMGACFPMALLSHRMCLVKLVDETLTVNHQLGMRLPAVVRRRIAAPANKITRSLPLHVTVVQDTLHVKALNTVRIHQ